jgi:hypothetical protein
VKDPQMQIRGVWTKLKPAGKAPSARLSHASFIWNSTLYICGGMASGAKAFFCDIWCLPLTPLGQWKKLPDFPSGILPPKGIRMAVWKDKALMFRGHRDRLGFFDLKTETWGTQKTTFGSSQRWPYNEGIFDQYSVEMFEDTMYVFGGDDSGSCLGTNVLMALDMKTWAWTHLGGTSAAIATQTMPNLRCYPNCWIVPKERRLYVLYGNANRSLAKQEKKPHGATDFQ